MCIYECAYTHTHTIPYSATWPQIGFPFTGSLHFKMENAQETKQVANQTPVQFGHRVCSIFPSQVTNCTERATLSFPLFFWCSSLQWLKRPNKHEKATCDSYILPQKRRCPEASLKCLYTNLHRLDDKQGELEVYTELQGWELAWNHRERVGQGSWLRHGHWRIQLVSEGKGWSGTRVTLHIIEFLDCIKCQHGTKSLFIDNL